MTRHAVTPLANLLADVKCLHAVVARRTAANRFAVAKLRLVAAKLRHAVAVRLIAVSRFAVAKLRLAAAKWLLVTADATRLAATRLAAVACWPSCSAARAAAAAIAAVSPLAAAKPRLAAAARLIAVNRFAVAKLRLAAAKWLLVTADATRLVATRLAAVAFCRSCSARRAAAAATAAADASPLADVSLLADVCLLADAPLRRPPQCKPLRCKQLPLRCQLRLSIRAPR